ncbi:MAG: hypothetical protein JOZ59_04325 [Candidatus Eremiobacteraeota bacterium]|nr:hypothetical protein [Candidatus Eremiobacteraeota bacterium]
MKQYAAIALCGTIGILESSAAQPSADRQIDMPGEALSAHALFTDYTILRSTVAAH